MQRALIRPVVERLDAEVASDAWISPTIAATASRELLRLVPAASFKLGELDDVVALVAVLRRLLAARERLDRVAELAHLRTRVVDVELTRRPARRETEHPREGVTVSGVAEPVQRGILR